EPTDRPTRAVVLSASYEARPFGVHSAQPVHEAARRCPDAVWIPPDFEKYERRSQEVLLWLEKRFGSVLPQSIDEAMVTVAAPDTRALAEVAHGAQSDLTHDLGLPSSWGGAPSGVVAKIASDVAKPNGVRIVDGSQIAEFLAPMSVRAIPGIGPKSAERLARVGIVTIADLGGRRRREIRELLGAWGADLVDLARGTIPPFRDAPVSGPVSRSVDRTFPVDEGALPALEASVRELARDLHRSVTKEGLRFGAVGIGLRWSDFQRTQRVRALPGSTSSLDALETAAIRLVRELYGEEHRGAGRDVRTVTVRVERLARESGRQARLDRYVEVGPDPHYGPE
ncbi:MAG: hypothetical protein LVQ64_03520, partial [Thermoplasmatales archaeon]|nr:hypothetical protein [Thermoplasmatales archaeon]